MPLKFSQLRLLVTDVKACFVFYRDVLGLPPVFEPDEEGTYADFDLGNNTSLGLYKRSMMADDIGTGGKPADADAQDRVAVTFQVDDVDAEVSALQAKGVIFIAPAVDRPSWGLRTAHFRDPDGNLLEIHAGVKQS